jgi:hypothetical protein
VSLSAQGITKWRPGMHLPLRPQHQWRYCIAVQLCHPATHGIGSLTGSPWMRRGWLHASWAWHRLPSACTLHQCDCSAGSSSSGHSREWPVLKCMTVQWVCRRLVVRPSGGGYQHRRPQRASIMQHRL